MSVVCDAIRDHVEVHNSCCQWTPCGCLWSVLPAETISVSMAWVATRAILVSVAYSASEVMWISLICATNKGYDGVQGPCCSTGLC